MEEHVFGGRVLLFVFCSAMSEPKNTGRDFCGGEALSKNPGFQQKSLRETKWGDPWLTTTYRYSMLQGMMNVSSVATKL